MGIQKGTIILTTTQVNRTFPKLDPASGRQTASGLRTEISQLLEALAQCLGARV